MFLAETSIQLVPDGTLLLHLLMVGVMVALLNRTLLKPINKILRDREDFVSGKSSEAQRMLEASDEKFKDYQNKLRNARTDGYQLLEKVKAQAVKEKDEKVRAFKEQSTQEVATQLKETKLQEELVQKDLESQAEHLGAMITSQILERR
ncbi:MAG TPA: ATP synthase F0 subunit B [Pyrinomonadaceae bacterium]